MSINYMVACSQVLAADGTCQHDLTKPKGTVHPWSICMQCANRTAEGRKSRPANCRGKRLHTWEMPALPMMPVTPLESFKSREAVARRRSYQQEHRRYETK